MQHSAWVALLKHIPEDQQSQFMLVTNSGTEIAIQSFMRVEQELVVIKGRLSGTQETGRVFFIPYRHIDYFGYSNPVKDVDFHSQFGTLTFPAAGAMETPPPEPPPQPQTTSTPAPPSGSDVRPAIRSEVLERYRSRPTSSPSLPNPKPNQS